MGAAGSRGELLELPPLSVGQRVVGEWAPGRRAPGVVEAVHGEVCDVLYDDGQHQYRVRRELLSAEPPEWWLECSSGRDGAAPLLFRPDAPAEFRHLRVGRAVQAAGVWGSLLPDETARNTISREHFEVRCGADMRFLIKNFSSRGTYLNGMLLHGEAPLRVGDAVAAGLLAAEGGLKPALIFRLVLGGPAALASEVHMESPEQPSRLERTWASSHSNLHSNRSLGLDRTLPMSSANPVQIPTSLQTMPLQPAFSEAPAAPTSERLATMPLTQPQLVFGPAAPPPRPQLQPPQPQQEVVKINLSFLPPPFALRCTFSRALKTPDFEALPVAERTLEATCQEARVRVGRAVQAASFWAMLLPDEAMRNAVSREHFEVALDEESQVMLWNLSTAGTLVNGKAIHDSVRLQHGDVITIRASSHDDMAIACFRLSVAGEQEEEDSFFDACPSMLDDDARPRLETETTIIDCGYMTSVPPTPLLNLLQRESTACQREMIHLQREGSLLREWTSGSRALGGGLGNALINDDKSDVLVRPPSMMAVRSPIMSPRKPGRCPDSPQYLADEIEI